MAFKFTIAKWKFTQIQKHDKRGKIFLKYSFLKQRQAQTKKELIGRVVINYELKAGSKSIKVKLGHFLNFQWWGS